MTPKGGKLTKDETMSFGLRMDKKVIEGLKRIAANEGLPYQTLLKSVLFKFVKSKGELRDIGKKE